MRNKEMKKELAGITMLVIPTVIMLICLGVYIRWYAPVIVLWGTVWIMYALHLIESE